MRRWIVRAIVFALVALPLMLGHAQAQSLPPPPVRMTIDANGVDLVDGSMRFPTPSITIGQPDAGGLTYIRQYDSLAQNWRDNLSSVINSSGTTYTVTLLGGSTRFSLAGGVFTPMDTPGASLSFDSGTNTYTFTTRLGAVALFSKALAGTSPTQANEGRMTTLTVPSGEVMTFTYTTLSASVQRIQSVTNNLGYQLHFQYQNNDPATGGLVLVKATALNNATDYCSPTANTCTFTQTWPSLTFGTESGGSVQTITDALNQTTRYFIDEDGFVGAIRLPTNTVNFLNINYNTSNNRVIALAYGGSSNLWSYSYSDASGQRTTTTTDPLSNTRVVVSNIANGTVVSDTNGVNQTISFTYNGANQLTRVTLPEGNYTDYAYDGRGNVTQTTEVAKSGSGLSNIVTSASYDSTCSNQVTCNLPNSTTDPRGNQTDYTYDSSHGGVLTVTLPDPDGGGPNVRPQTRYSYGSLYAWYKNSGGSIVQAATPVAHVTEVSACMTTSSCAGGADEAQTIIDYGSTGVANNRLPISTSSGSGDGSLTATIAYTYDPVGNLLTVDGPLSGTADTTRFRYDSVRQQIGIVGPDPDGGGSLKHRAIRVTYNANGWVTMVERGTVDGMSDPNWAAFASLQQGNVSFNALGLPVRQTLTASGTTFSVSDLSYDAANRQECAAIRMNPTLFGALPASACTLGTAGPNGPDRITRQIYDAANRVTQVQSAYGAPAQQTALALTYTNNGLPTTITDAAGNVTIAEYDGFDRQRKLRYPNATGGGTSTSDYEQWSYDAASNVTQARRRDGQTINYEYDTLNRLTTLDAPSTSLDVDYAYDNLSRLLSSATPSQTLSYTYDALSRNLTQASPLGTVSYQYDIASRQTRITWPDAFYAEYDYDLTNAVTAIRENGATSGIGVLATYAYDNLGRRTGITRGNSVATAYGYDGASRLTSLAHDLAGSGDDQTYTMSYNAGSQSLTRDGSNASWDWSPPGPGTTAYTDNGLNQYPSVGGTSFTYDSRGNLTGDGSRTYGYDVFNRMTSVSGGGSLSLSYDPAGRLYETNASGTATRFLYNGAEIIAEYDGSGNVLRRYVNGAWLDQQVTWYEGAGTSSRSWLLADPLGSIVARASSAGAASNIYSYDEYGQPSAWSTPGAGGSRFRYAGAVMLPEAQLYHMRARSYAPAIGRFAQTDPIGFDGGINFYAYVGNDPINLIDLLGTKGSPKGETITVTGVRTVVVVHCCAAPGITLGSAGTAGTRGGGSAGPGTSRQTSEEETTCPADEALMDLLSDLQESARGLDTAARLTGVNREIGGALGRSPAGVLRSSSVQLGRGAVNLPSARSAFQSTWGFPPQYDFHTHVAPGVNGATYGFSRTQSGGGDVLATAIAPDTFIGSFVVMPDRILFLPRAAAIAAVRNDEGSQEGIRCN